MSPTWENGVSFLFETSCERGSCVTLPATRRPLPGASHTQDGQPSPSTPHGSGRAHYTAVCCYNAPINFPFDILRAIYKSCRLSFVPSLMLGNSASAWRARLPIIPQPSKQASSPACWVQRAARWTDSELCPRMLTASRRRR